MPSESSTGVFSQSTKGRAVRNPIESRPERAKFTMPADDFAVLSSRSGLLDSPQGGSYNAIFTEYQRCATM
jgi:hypothetical protein